MSDKELNDLKALLEDELQLDSGNSNHDFHYAIVQGSQNRRLSHLLCDDLYHLMRMYRYQLGRDSGRASTASKEHGLILDALQDRDGEMAELLMRRHIRKSRAYIEKMIMPRSQGD